MLPILLCVVGWVWSTNHDVSIERVRNERVVSLSTQWGSIGYVDYGDSIRYVGMEGWHFRMIQCPARVFPDNSIEFLCFSDWDPRARAPYWFLILVFSIPLFIVWRKTRSKIDPRRAFAVELTDKKRPD
jgi:hypothetical protein